MLRRFIVSFLVSTPTSTFVSTTETLGLGTEADRAVWIAIERARNPGSIVQLKDYRWTTH